MGNTFRKPRFFSFRTIFWLGSLVPRGLEMKPTSAPSASARSERDQGIWRCTTGFGDTQLQEIWPPIKRYCLGVRRSPGWVFSWVPHPQTE